MITVAYMAATPLSSHFKVGLFAILLCALPLHAQWNPAATGSLGAGMASINLATGNLNLGRISLAERDRGSTDSRSTRHNVSGLMFTSSPVVSARLRQTIERNVLAHVQPEKQAEVRQVWSHFQPVAGFNSVIAKHGYSPNNMADVMTMYWIFCWQVVHGPSDQSPATIRAIDRQLQRSLLASRALARLGNNEKQQLAEIMAYEAVFWGFGYAGFRGAKQFCLT
jgi:hypothetical protein